MPALNSALGTFVTTSERQLGMTVGEAVDGALRLFELASDVFNIQTCCLG